MITNAKLADVFLREYEGTRSVEAAVAAIRRTIEAEREPDEEASRRPRRARGPRSVCPLGPGRIDELKQAVAREFGIGPDRLAAGTTRDCVEARYVLCAALRGQRLSYPQIARALGLRSHTGVMEAVARVGVEQELGARLARVMERVGADGRATEPASAVGQRKAA